MELQLYDADFIKIGVVDTFRSLLWIDRYAKFGEIELIISPDSPALSKLASTAYILLEESEHIMIPESFNIKTDPKRGNEVIVKGKSLESILLRRIVWAHTTLEGSLQDGIALLLNDSMILAEDPNRIISRMEFLASEDPVITALTVDGQSLGEYIYDIVSGLCSKNGIGFKIILTPTNNFQFQLYAGVDRSYNQSNNPYIVFSPNNDNLVNGNLLVTSEFLKTTALVAGEAGVGNERTITTAESVTGASDLDRREIFVDAGSITRSGYGEEEPLTDEEYLVKLEEEGLRILSENTVLESFDGEIDPVMYNYGDEFYMGDILQVANEYGNESCSRVVEMTYFQDSAGIKTVPTFEAV